MPDINIDQITDQIGQLGTHLQEARESLDKKVDAQVKEAEDRITKELAQRFADRQSIEAREKAEADLREGIFARMDELDTAIKRLNAGGGSAQTEALNQERAVFADFLRVGATQRVKDYVRTDEYRERLRQWGNDARAETRALSEGVDSEGGYLVSPVIAAEIIKSARNFSPLRTVAKTTSINSGNSYVRPYRVSGASMTWESESGTGTESSAVYGRRNIPVHPAMVKTRASRDFLADGLNAEQEVMMEAAEAIGIGEGTAFVSGTGVGRPEGFIINATNIANKIAGADGASDLLSPDDFYTALIGTGAAGSGLQQQYRGNATFVMNSTVLAKALKFKDDNNNYLWNLQQGLQAGIPAQIAGRPFVILEDMQDDGTNGNYPLAVADWQRAYEIVDRSGIELIRDPYSAKPDIEFMWRLRLGGQTIDPAAIRLVQV